MNLLKIIKLAHILTKLAEVSTDKGVLTVEEIAVDREAYMEKEGQIVPAEDGEYILDDQKTVVIKDGKILEIRDVAEEQKPEEQKPAESTEGAPAQVSQEAETAPADGGEAETETPAPDEKDERIKELEEALKGKDAEIERLLAEIETLKNAPVEEQMRKVQANEIPFKVYKH